MELIYNDEIWIVKFEDHHFFNAKLYSQMLSYLILLEGLNNTFCYHNYRQFMRLNCLIKNLKTFSTSKKTPWVVFNKHGLSTNFHYHSIQISIFFKCWFTVIWRNLSHHQIVLTKTFTFRSRSHMQTFFFDRIQSMNHSEFCEYSSSNYAFRCILRSCSTNTLCMNHFTIFLWLFWHLHWLRTTKSTLVKHNIFERKKNWPALYKTTNFRPSNYILINCAIQNPTTFTHLFWKVLNE